VSDMEERTELATLRPIHVVSNFGNYYVKHKNMTGSTQRGDSVRTRFSRH